MKVLITGGASGIAFLTALTLAERGHFIYLTCHTEDEVLNVKNRVCDYKNIEVLKVDITKKEDRKKVLDLDIDVLYSNAGVGASGSLLELNISDMRKTFEVNVFSSFTLIKDVLRQMIDKNYGRIIVMSSLAGDITFPFLGVYSASKASINSMVEALRLELRTLDVNVDVTLIKPGLYHTGFNQYLIDSKYDYGKYFKDIKNTLYKLEHSFLFLMERRKLDSIIVKIVRAVEDEKLKKEYRAPFFQSILVKIFSIFK